MSIMWICLLLIERDNSNLLSGSGGMGQADSDSVDAAVGAGEDFETQAVFFDDFAGERDVAGDL